MRKYLFILIINLSRSLGSQEIDLSMAHKNGDLVISMPKASGFEIMVPKNSSDQFAIRFRGIEIMSLHITNTAHMQQLVGFIIGNYPALTHCTPNKKQSLITSFINQLRSQNTCIPENYEI